MLNVNYCTKNNLCFGCGICEDICPHNAISVKESAFVFRPFVEEHKCSSCGLCLRACAGHKLDIKKISDNLYKNENSKYDKYIGNFTECYYGHCRDELIRYNSSSGGVLSAFLIYLLEKGVIQGAAVTKFSDKNPLRTETFIATDREEIISARGSKYCPVSLSGILKQIENFDGKVAVVGLPCHIQSLRKAAPFNPKAKNKIAGLFALYCSHIRNYRFMNALLKRHKILASEVKHFSFRADSGCLGKLKIETERNISEEIFLKYYLRYRSFFKPKRCASCIDHYCALADISFGDIHLKPYFNEIGENSVIARNPIFNEYLQNAVKDGYLSLEKIPAEHINASQVAMFKRIDISAPFHLKFEKLLGRTTPIYDVELKCKNYLKGFYLWLSYGVQRAAGRFL